jgi:centractin
MLNNVVLAGGTTMIPGFKERVTHELYSHFHKDRNYDLHVTAENYRNISTWIGGSMLASMSTFKELFFTKNDLKEQGERLFPKVF